MTFAQVEGLRTDPAVAGASESYSLAIVRSFRQLMFAPNLAAAFLRLSRARPSLLVSIALFLSLNNIHADAVFKHQVY